MDASRATLGKVYIQPSEPQTVPHAAPTAQPQVAPIDQRTHEAGTKTLNPNEPSAEPHSLKEHTAVVEPPAPNAEKIPVSLETAVPGTAPPVKRRSIINVTISPGGRTSIELADAGATGKTISAPIRSQIDVKVPNDAVIKLTRWFVQHDRTLRETNGSRIAYKQTEIAPALKRFEKDFQCSWHAMKHGCTGSEEDKKFLQIVNDLRASYLEEIFAGLKADFPNLTIDDFGSSKLTSDRDFALGGFGADRQTMNTTIDKQFNARFEAIWKAPSAIVFDSNAYTTQHVMKATDPHMEASRSDLQHEGSLLMKLRNGTPESWENFKSTTLAKITDPARQARQTREFGKVEKENAELRLQLNKEIVKIAIEGSHHAALKESIGKYLNTPLDLLPDTVVLDLNKAATAIKSHDPLIEVQASNNLYEGIKTGYGVLEKERLDLFSALRSLDELSSEDNPTEFAQTFNATTKSFIGKFTKELTTLENKLKTEKDPKVSKDLQNQIDDLKNQIGQLENTLIPKEDETGVMQAYKDRSTLGQAEKNLHEKRIELEGHVTHFKRLQKKSAELTSSTGSGGTLADLTKVETAISALKKQYGAKTLEELSSKMNQEIGKVEAELNEVQKKSEQLSNEHGAFWDQVGAIGVEGDRLLIDMQRSHLQGMCFAQEAHVSEGAIGFVVFNIQAGKTDVRTIEQYTQAFIEVSGYCSGHQAKAATPHGRMVEVSKYAERLGVAMEHIQERAESLKIPPPPLEDVSRLLAFFKKIAPLRGTGKSESDVRGPVEESAREMGLISRDGAFDQKAVSRINEQIDGLAGTLEAWVKENANNQRNAYYSM